MGSLLFDCVVENYNLSNMSQSFVATFYALQRIHPLI